MGGLLALVLALAPRASKVILAFLVPVFLKRQFFTVLQAVSSVLPPGCELVAWILLLLGLVSLIDVVTRFTLWILYRFVLPGASLKKYFQNGKWTVVTGASDGIGSGYARVLAQKKANLILISRTESKLIALRDELVSKNPDIKVEILSVDYSRPPEEIYPRVEQILRGKQVSVLVNNVGISDDVPTEFVDAQVEELERIVYVNINSAIRMTKIILPLMIENKEGLILNLSSFTAENPLPLSAVYAGSKAFLDVWSRALSAECESHKVHVVSIKPAYVISNMTGFQKKHKNFFILTPEELARASLDQSLRYRSVMPCVGHETLNALSSLIGEEAYLVQSAGLMRSTRKKRLTKRTDDSSQSSTKNSKKND